MLSLKPFRPLIPMLAGVIALSACVGAPGGPAPVAVIPATTAPAPTASTTSGQAGAPKPTVAPSPTVEVLPTTAPAPTSAAPAPTAEPNPTADPITGAPGLARGELTQRPYAVMIDNHPDAYPQTGLDRAAVVFEALAEFGVTRFIAIFAPGSGRDAPQIGPVRSTRLYFAEWAMGFHALYAHAGGSPEGLALVESTDQLINVDALRKDGGAYFARSSDRDAPHNLYTSSADLARAAADRGVADLSDAEVGFLFKTDAASQRPPSQRLSYFFLYEDDPAGWTYDPQTNGYLRLRRGKPARDGATGAQLWTKNVVVMEVHEAKIAGDPKGRIEQNVIGSGPARLLMDGVEREISWRKEAPEAPLRFYVADSEVRFNAGPIWIVALPSLDNLTVE